MAKWPEIKGWFIKLKPKKEQDRHLLMNQIREAGSDLYNFQRVWLKPDFMKFRRRRGFAVCP